MGSNPTGIRDIFSFSVWANFLSRAIAQKVLFGIFIRARQLTTFKTTIYMLSPIQTGLLGGSSDWGGEETTRGWNSGTIKDFAVIFW